MDELFQHRRFVITGASAGIGEEFARELHRRGSEVILVARRAERLEQLSQELNRVRPGSARSVPLDLARLTDRDFSESPIGQIFREERIDGLMNNAGFGSFGTFAELDLEREIEMVRVNVLAPLCLTHAVLPQMIARGSGVIVHVSSIAAYQPLPYMSTYAATKAMNLSFGLSQHFELRARGIRTVVVCPGPIATEFAAVANFPGGFRGPADDSVSTVVKAALDAAERGRPLVVPGAGGKLLAFGARLLPGSLRMRLIERYLRRLLPNG